MRKFDLLSAKAGDRVCLRNGLPAKILDFDYNGVILYKFTETLADGSKCDESNFANQDGACMNTMRYEERERRMYDLMMAPKYAFMNVYMREEDTTLIGDEIHEDLSKCDDCRIYSTDKKFLCYARIELFYNEHDLNAENF